MNVTKKIILLLAICCMMCMGSMADVFAQKGQSVSHVTLRIRLNNIESNEGRIMIAVYNTADSFLKNAFKVMSDAEGVMGPPSFKSCSFNLKEDTIVSITLR